MKKRGKSKTADSGSAVVCAVCGQEIPGEYLKDGEHGPLSYCPTCKAHYCWVHYPAEGWQGVAAGIDYQYLNATCPKGHSRLIDDSYA